MGKAYRYPTTPHIPASQGRTTEDVALRDLSCLMGRPVVITEKMDGENVSVYQSNFHGRTTESPLDARGRLSPNHSHVRDVFNRIAPALGKRRVCGEALREKNHIEYRDLEDFFLTFSVWEGEACLSWGETVDFCVKLELPMVPVLYVGSLTDDALAALVKRFKIDAGKEGFVIRSVGPFDMGDFSRNVAKWTRYATWDMDEPILLSKKKKQENSLKGSHGIPTPGIPADPQGYPEGPYPDHGCLECGDR